MTYLEAAYKILAKAGQPLHYAEIAQRALTQSLITPTGQTPAATMGSRLYTDTLNEGSAFLRAGRGLFELATKQSGGIDAQVQQINLATRTQLRELLTTMPPQRFEALITELLLQMGFDESTVTVTPYGGDGGIDVVGVYRAAGLTEVSAAVQVKRWKRNIQAPTVTQLRGSLQVHQQGIIITTSNFSKGAQAEATAPNKTRIGLINGDELLELLIKHRVGVTEKMLRVIGLDDEWWGELINPAPVEVVEVENSQAQVSEHKTKTSRIKPTSMTLCGQVYPVRSWKEILITTCTVLASEHGEAFNQKVIELCGHKRAYFATLPANMFKAEPIPGTDLWVETNFSAKAIMKLSQLVLTAVGWREEDLIINLAEPES